MPLPTAVKYATPLPTAMPERDDVADVAVHRLARCAAHLGDFGPVVPPAFGREIDRRRRDAASRRHLSRREGARLRAEPQGVDAVGEDGAAVGGTAGLQAADRAGKRQHARVVLSRRIRGRARVDRRVLDDLAVVGPQHVEAAVLAAGPHDLGRHALHVDREDLRRVADRTGPCTARSSDRRRASSWSTCRRG